MCARGWEIREEGLRSWKEVRGCEQEVRHEREEDSETLGEHTISGAGRIFSWWPGLRDGGDGGYLERTGRRIW